ncbi:hypothetical protein LB505_000667 [Fusarium chuoi]|nr:hypothetical protein LB505_000667 [Fusarium chuoi]
MKTQMKGRQCRSLRNGKVIHQDPMRPTATSTLRCSILKFSGIHIWGRHRSPNPRTSAKTLQSKEKESEQDVLHAVRDISSVTKPCPIA